ncbi:MAG TPA: Clp protease N-terminal domain-containing protein [Trebonia sp.]|nr:Clp protease N-terminal domain-containing protein [Trebonia sp.]
MFGTEPARRGTPAVEAALQQAARLAGPLPVGSHHLLLAALNDPNSAASAALTSLGVDQGELRVRLRAAKVAGTSDEQPEQAGRRQMAIEVSDEMLHVVLTDPVIVGAGRLALRAVNEQAAAEAGGRDAEKSATASVIRGDHPAAAGLATVWLELRKTLGTLASVGAVKDEQEKAAAAAPDPDAPADPGEEPA